MGHWTQRENDVLLDAIEQGVNSKNVIELVLDKTNRSRKSIERRLKKIGYLRSCGQRFASKQGFVR